MKDLSEAEIGIFTGAVRDYFGHLGHDSAEVQGAWLLEGSAPPPLDDLTGAIDLGGDFAGAVYFTAPRQLVRHILVSLKETDHSEENLRDAIGEVANTIAGNARRLFGEQLHVSVPRTLAGKGNAPDASVRHRPYAVRLRWKHYEATLIVDISRK